MQKIRLRYAKRDRARFTSHRDFGRAFERALRRAHVPMAYSSGFNPHPRISYANASPTGAATEAEYLEIGLWEVCDPEKVMAALNEVLPPGFVMAGAVVAESGSLADGLEASSWEVRWHFADGEREILEAAVAAFGDAEKIEVERMMKNGLRTFDARGPVELLEVLDADTEGRAGLGMVICHAVPLVRPEDVLSALAVVSDFVKPVGPRQTRLAQGKRVGERVENLF